MKPSHIIDKSIDAPYYGHRALSVEELMMVGGGEDCSANYGGYCDNGVTCTAPAGDPWGGQFANAVSLAFTDPAMAIVMFGITFYNAVQEGQFGPANPQNTDAGGNSW